MRRGVFNGLLAAAIVVRAGCVPVNLHPDWDALRFCDKLPSQIAFPIAFTN